MKPKEARNLLRKVFRLEKEREAKFLPIFIEYASKMGQLEIAIGMFDRLEKKDFNLQVMIVKSIKTHALENCEKFYNNILRLFNELIEANYFTVKTN